MNKTISELSKKYSHIGSYLLLTPNSFVIFGNQSEEVSKSNDDMVILGKCKYRHTQLVINSKVIDHKEDELKLLNSKVESLIESSAYGSFLLAENGIKKIKKCIKNIDATHLRIHNVATSVRISIFDYRQFLDKSRIQRKVSQKIRYYDSDNANVGDDFTVTINAASFLKLPIKDTIVRINTNGICQFEPIQDDLKYLMRDQDIIEPITTFFSDRLDCQISLALLPNS